jgi:hypothetical protein
MLSEVRLHPALPGDFGFRWALHFSPMRTLLEALGAWEEKKGGQRLQGTFHA